MILTDEELAKFSDYPVLPGVAAMLMKTNDKTKKLRSKAYFGCKHCVPNPRKFLAVWVCMNPSLTRLLLSRPRSGRN